MKRLFLSLLLIFVIGSLSFAGVPAPDQPAPKFALPGLFDAKTIALDYDF